MSFSSFTASCSCHKTPLCICWDSFHIVSYSSEPAIVSRVIHNKAFHSAVPIAILRTSFFSPGNFKIFSQANPFLHPVINLTLHLAYSLWKQQGSILHFLRVTYRILTLYTPKAIIVLHRIIRSWYTGRWRVGCYSWYSEEGPGRAAAPPSPLLAVPNVTAHPSTANVPISVLLYDGPLLCGYNMPIKG